MNTNRTGKTCMLILSSFFLVSLERVPTKPFIFISYQSIIQRRMGSSCHLHLEIPLTKTGYVYIFNKGCICLERLSISVLVTMYKQHLSFGSLTRDAREAVLKRRGMPVQREGWRDQVLSQEAAGRISLSLLGMHTLRLLLINHFI